jgi:N-acetyl-gamma-glutamyl-phosphate reductase
MTIRDALRVANPGCYATGGVLALRPIADRLKDYPVSVFGVGGVTSGGNRLVQAHEEDPLGFRLYGLDLEHRHTAEIAHYAQLEALPMFMPGVAAYAQGTLVQIPLSLGHLGLSGPELWARYEEAYEGTGLELVPGHGLTAGEAARALDASALAGTDRVELRLDVAADGGRAVVTVRFDNLGKGAAGAALANLLLMLGLG